RFTPFFGRAAEIAQVVERCAFGGASADRQNESGRDAGRLLTIIAPGGMGKTRLAIAAAEVIAEQPGYPDGIYFLALARVASADSLPAALAAAFNISLAGAAGPVDQLVAVLRPMRALLLLDNFEHLIEDGVDLVERLLEEAPYIHILVTSREALNVRFEERFPLGGLAGADGTALFAAAAARVRPGYTPDPADIVAIRDLVRDVGGMPLAIELAATWM